MRTLGILSLAISALRFDAVSQSAFPHTELVWSTVSTQHFLVHYHQGTEQFADRTARFLEELYPFLVDLYKYAPDQKISFILRDHDDYSNGAAYFYDNKVEIWVPSLDFELRGAHPWLENVLTHELTHIFQIQVSMKWTRRIPAFYLQWLGYESERRPDVLYGYPNVLASYPISGFVVPAWFAEGTAQYNHPDLRYDTWDSHRDMIQRMHVLEGTALSWEDMAVFGKTSLGNESSYNAGFSIVDYVAKTYGDSAVIAIARELGTLTRTSIGGAVEDVLGMTGERLYEEWMDSKRGEYERVREGIQKTRTEGDLLEGEGFANFHPVFSRDGRKLYVCSNRGEDYTGQSRIVEYDMVTRESRVVVSRAKSTLSLSPDGRFLYYARISRDNPNWSLISDIYEYDLVEEEETRLTHGWRAYAPRLSTDGTKLVFAVASGGSMNVATCDIRKSKFEIRKSLVSNYRTLSRFSNFEQVYTPVWSADGASIAFGFSQGHNQTLAMIDSSGEHLRFFDAERASFTQSWDHDSASDSTIPQSEISPRAVSEGRSLSRVERSRGRNPRSFSSDSRNPHFSPDGNWLYFAWDVTGRFNLYRMSTGGGSLQQVSEVLGGAFYPAVDSAGRVAYSRYDATGYKTALLEPAKMTEGRMLFESRVDSQKSTDEGNQKTEIRGQRSEVRSQKSEVRGQRSEDGARRAEVEGPEMSGGAKDSTLISRPYTSVFSSLSLYPVIRVDNYNPSNKGIDIIKPGLYFASNEVLDKVGLFAGAAINRKAERDLFLIFQFSDALPLLSALNLEPTLSLELYNISRATESSFSLFTNREHIIPVDITYNLLEFDATLTQALFSEYATVTLGYTRSRYSAELGSFIIPDVGLNPSFRNVYLLGHSVWLDGKVRAIHPNVDEAINPVGRTIRARATYESNEYNRDLEYDVVDGILVPLYKDFRFVRWEGWWNEHLRMPWNRHTLNLSLHAGAITGGVADTIFHFYGGGMVGLKGYPFYSIEGTKLALAQVAYRFPIFQRINTRILHLTFTKLYASVFAEVGDAWTGSAGRFRAKKDVGAELRLESFSFYAYPTRFSLSAAYGLDAFDRVVQGERIRYGKEWRFYFNVLFDFDISEPMREKNRWKM